MSIEYNTNAPWAKAKDDTVWQNVVPKLEAELAEARAQLAEANEAIRSLCYWLSQPVQMQLCNNQQIMDMPAVKRAKEEKHG